MSRRRKVPSYCRHKASGQAYVTLAGREHYLGVYGTPESRERYSRLIAEYIAGQSSVVVSPRAGSSLSVNELALLYWERHVLKVHVHGGRPSDRQYHIRLSLRPLKELFGDNWFFGLATIRVPDDYFESTSGVAGEDPGGFD